MALEAGFDAAGLTPLAPPPAQQHFRRWLAAGHHAGMEWLERQAPRILDPARLLEGGKSLLMVVEGHAREAVELVVTHQGAEVALDPLVE